MCPVVSLRELFIEALLQSVATTTVVYSEILICSSVNVIPSSCNYFEVYVEMHFSFLPLSMSSSYSYKRVMLICKKMYRSKHEEVYFCVSYRHTALVYRISSWSLVSDLPSLCILHSLVRRCQCTPMLYAAHISIPLCE